MAASTRKSSRPAMSAAAAAARAGRLARTTTTTRTSRSWARSNDQGRSIALRPFLLSLRAQLVREVDEALRHHVVLAGRRLLRAHACPVLVGPPHIERAQL